jgi:hypothetical protein
MFIVKIKINHYKKSIKNDLIVNEMFCSKQRIPFPRI